MEEQVSTLPRIRPMIISDYPQVYALWSRCAGFSMKDADDCEAAIRRFLERNPDTCFVAEDSSGRSNIQTTHRCNRTRRRITAMECLIHVPHAQGHLPLPSSRHATMRAHCDCNATCCDMVRQMSILIGG